MESAKVKQAVYYDRGSKLKIPLNMGDTVRARLQDFDRSSGRKKLEVTQTLPHRSYVMKNQMELNTDEFPNAANDWYNF